MNHIYRIVWNAATGLWQCVSEIARTKGQSVSQSVSQSTILHPEKQRLHPFSTNIKPLAYALICLLTLSPAISFSQTPCTTNNAEGCLITSNWTFDSSKPLFKPEGNVVIGSNNGQPVTVTVTDNNIVNINKKNGEPANLSLGKNSKLIVDNNGVLQVANLTTDSSAEITIQNGGAISVKKRDDENDENEGNVDIDKAGSVSQLNLMNRGTLTAEKITIANGGNSNFTLKDHSTLIANKELIIGQNGSRIERPSLDNKSRISVLNGRFLIGTQNNSVAILTLNNSSNIEVNNTNGADFFIGHNGGTGSIKLFTNSSINATSDIIIGSGNNSKGYVILKGESQLNVGKNENITANLHIGKDGGTGSLTVTDSKVSVKDNVYIDNNSRLEVQNNSTLTVGKNIEIEKGGNLILYPSSTLAITVNSPSDYSKIHAKGELDLNSSTLEVRADKAKDLIDKKLKDVVKADGGLKRQFGKVTTDSQLFYFVADYSEKDTVHLNIKPKGEESEMPPAPPAQTPPAPPAQTPPAPPAQTPPAPPAQTPPAQTPPAQTPPAQTPPAQTPPAQTPPAQTPQAPAPQAPAPQTPAPQTPPAQTPICNTVTSCVKAENNLVTLPVAAVLDTAIQQHTAGSLAKEFVTLNSQKAVSQAASETLPILIGGDQRVVMNAANIAADSVQDRIHMPMTPSAMHPHADRNVWGKVIGTWDDQKVSGSIPGYRTDNQGIILGADSMVTDSLRLGGALSYVHSEANSRGGVVNHQLKANSYHGLVYGSYDLNDAANIDFQVGLGHAGIDGKRHIAFANKTAKSDYSAKIAQTGIGFNYRFGDEERNITPFVRADYQWLKTEGYKETGADALNLNVEKNNRHSLVWSGGVRLEQNIADNLRLHGEASVGVESLDTNTRIRSEFAGLSGHKFSTVGADNGRVSGKLNLGTTWIPAKNWEVSGQYQLDMWKKFTGQSASLSVKMKF